jgi:tetratricopeptide (TPR) repeat protein
MKVRCSSLLFLLAAILITAGCTHNKTIEGFSATDWSEISDTNWSKIGRQAIDANRWNEALNAYDKVLELNPNDASAYYNRGLAYSNLGNYKLAILNYDRAIELNPKDADAYYNRGNAYSRLGNSSYAKEDWKIAAKLGNIFAQKSLKEKGITW